VSDDYTTLKTQFNNTVENHIGAWVASAAAIGVPLITAFCAWLQKKLGIKLDPAELTAFIASMAAGIIITAYKWLSNRGSWEQAVVDAYRVYLTGQSATGTHVLVTSPPATVQPDGQPQQGQGTANPGGQAARP